MTYAKVFGLATDDKGEKGYGYLSLNIENAPVELFEDVMNSIFEDNSILTKDIEIISSQEYEEKVNSPAKT